MRLAILASGSGSNLEALIKACQAGRCAAQAALAICNKAGAGALARAEALGVPTKLIAHKDYPSREAFEDAMLAELRAAEIDIVALAGFMRILTPRFIEPFAGRMLNIHPSLLPSFPGVDAGKQAFEHGVKVTGVTVHFVTPEMDAGPIVLQKAVEILADDDLDSLMQRIHALEHELFPAAVDLLARGALQIEGKRVRVLPKG